MHSLQLISRLKPLGLQRSGLLRILLRTRYSSIFFNSLERESMSATTPKLIQSTKIGYEFEKLILNTNYHFITDFCQVVHILLRATMNPKLEEIRRKIAKLEKEAEELQRLKSDCNDAERFRRMLVKEKAD